MNKRLFVGNLSFDISEEQLQEAFAPYGSTGATIPARWVRNAGRDDRPKGFGFVDVPAERAEAAIAAMDGRELDGRAINVSEARPRPEVHHWGLGRRQEERGGRGYGRGGHGRGGRW